MNKLIRELKSQNGLNALKAGLRIVISAVIAFAFYDYFNSPENNWIIFSGFLLIQIRLGATFWKQIGWTALLGVLAASSVWLTAWFGGNIVLLSLYLLSTTFFTVAIGVRYREFFLPLCLVNLFGMLSGGLPIALSYDNERFCFVLLGTLIVIVTNILFWSRRHSRNFVTAAGECLDALQNLQKTFFEIYLNRDYEKNHYVYEKKIHEKTRCIFLALHKIQGEALNSSEKEIVESLMRLYEMVIAQGHLRFRVSDFTTFGVIAKELRDLAAAEFQEANLADRISALEDVYQSALQVVAPEPLAFLFFIQNLQDFERELNYFYSLNVK